jgi:hypothetical protein
MAERYRVGRSIVIAWFGVADYCSCEPEKLSEMGGLEGRSPSKISSFGR